MNNIYEGDPKLTITEEGAEIPFPGDGGQPQMEQGVENLAIISLFTEEGWEGNFYFKDPNNQSGSDYQETTNPPITLSKIEKVRQSTIRALNNPAFGDVESFVTVPASNRWNNLISTQPPGENRTEILTKKNGLNWIFQAEKGQGE